MSSVASVSCPCSQICIVRWMPPEEVTGVDASEEAIQMAERNADLNGFQNVRFLTADVLDLLPKLRAEGKKYDLVILDPPAFAKSRANVRNATKGYTAINRDGMRLVREGGFLATCSCSHFMTRELFEKMLREAAREAHVRIRQVEERAQSPDHPVLWTAEESYYLKPYPLWCDSPCLLKKCLFYVSSHQIHPA